MLQLAFDLADFKQVRAHWKKHFLRRFRPTDPVHALMGRVLHQIRTDGYVVRESYVFPLDEVAVASEDCTQEEQARTALYQLDSVCFFFEMPTQQIYVPRHLLDSTQPQGSHYTSTSVTVLFNPQLREYLLNVAQLDELFPPTQPPQ
ncbi:hypothetical protein A0257_22270 [Hymenobacter psoromatis]|nr:hypothetical protein A0257_22270 [Hymenobacter psoromatis]